MFAYHITRQWKAAFVLALSLLALIVRSSFCAPLTDVQRQADPRLQKKVTIVASHILIGELLEKLSAQSGVSLTVGEKDGAGDAEVLVSLKDVKLADAMDALYSLVSYKQAEWSWEQTGEGKDASYRLVQPPVAQALASTLKAQVQKDIEGQAKKMADALKLTPEQLKEAARNDPLLRSIDSKDFRVRPGMTMFSELPAEVRNLVLQGGKRVQMPVSALSPQGQAYVHQETQWAREHGWTSKDKNGNAIPVMETQTIMVYMHQFSNQIAPGLAISCGFGSGEYFGGAFLEKEWRNKLKTLWLLPGDAKDDAVDARQVKTPQPAKPEPDPRHAFHSRALQLADAVNLPVIARLFNEDGFGSSASNATPYGKTVEAFLTHLQDDVGMPHKWRDGILLLTYNGWFMEENDESRVPWAIVKRLRDSESAAPDGFLPVSELFWAARHLTRPQMTRLADWFPVMANVANWYDLFSLAANSSELQTALLSKTGSTRGDALTAASAMLGMGQRGVDQTTGRMTVADLRAAQQKAAEQRIADGTFKRVRLTLGDYLTETPAMREVMVEALSPTGQRVGAQGFRYPKHQFVSAGRK